VATVLVCDDEDVLRALVRATLSRERYTVVEARNGDDALEHARRHRPEVIVLDMMMPGRSGLDVLAEVRADADLAAIRIVVLSARAQQADRERAERAGADRFLTKPFSPIELAAVVDDLAHG
jgi:two-component system, OmpR family, response regulator